MNIKLSISLLASDKPAALERCLDSLFPLLMQIPSELIIVHTGTDPKVHGLASRYTDQVIPFVWCGDFSAARNIGVQAAKGEWFLYIDDDEWFEDTSAICNFFQSGEYLRYGMACYRQRNYADWSGTRYTDFYAMRMMRMVPGIHFQNPIHEEPTPLTGPCKYFDAYVHHYGYVQKSGSSKASRNLMILKKDMAKRPGYVKNYIQLVSEYGSEENWEKAEDYCREGLELYRSRKAPADSGLNWLQSELVELLYLRKKYYEAEQDALLIFGNGLPCELTAADIYATLVLSSAACHNSEKTLRYGLKFEEALQVLEKNPQLWARQNYGSLSIDKIKDPKRLCRLRAACLEAALEQGAQTHAAFFFSRLPWDNEALMERLYPELDRLDSRYAQFSVLLKKQVPGSSYQALYRAVHTRSGRKERKQVLIGCITESSSDYLKQQAVNGLVSSGMELNDAAGLLDLDTWQRYLAGIVKGLSDPEAQEAWKSQDTLEEEYLCYRAILKKELLGRALAQGYYAGEKFLQALSEYADSILLFYKAQYREELFQEENLKLLPQPCRFALLISEAVQKAGQKAYPEAAGLLCAALPLDTEMTGVIGEFGRQITGKIRNPAQGAGEEFSALARQMKAVLGDMLQKGQYKEALPVIKQLSALLPSDLDLLRFRQKLLRESE